MTIPKFDEHLSAPNLINIAKNFFNKIKDPRERRFRRFELSTFLISGVALFFLKCSSLLSFCEDEQRLSENVEKIFGILEIPSDTHFRTVVDEVSTEQLKNIFKAYYFFLKEKEVLKKFEAIDNSFLVLSDGTSFFSSKNVHCGQCLQKQHKDGTITYSHQALPAVIAHPDHKEVFPIGIEFIEKQDGDTKNDCESNASKRLLAQLRLNYPKEKFIIVEDGLSSNVPHVLELEKNKMNFILGTKPGNHKKFFEEIARLERAGLMMKHSHFEKSGNEEITREFRYKNCLNLNQGEGEIVYVNFFEVVETVLNKKTKELKKTIFSWITDIKITPENILKLMKFGRARWMIENETFNTLKNQGYNFEHNYGHGEKNLINNMCLLMFIAFLIDQIQQCCCKLFQLLLEKAKRKIRLWNQLRSYFETHINESLEDIYIKMLTTLKRKDRRILNSS